MKIWHIKIEGKTPIILNVRKRELDLEKKQLKKDELEEWEVKKENWSRKAELNNKDEVVVPSRWFRAALRDTCKITKMVPHYATKKNETYTRYAETFTIISNGKSLCKKEDLQSYDDYVNVGTFFSKKMIWTVRPLVEKWGAEFDIIDPAGRMKKEELSDLITYMGLYIRMGDNRKNNFGSFLLKSIRLIEKKE